MYIRNKRGPSTVPCGTPEVTGEEGDVLPFNHFLVPFSQETLNPSKCLVTDPVMVELGGKASMGHLVKRLAEIQ